MPVSASNRCRRSAGKTRESGAVAVDHYHRYQADLADGVAAVVLSQQVRRAGTEGR